MNDEPADVNWLEIFPWNVNSGWKTLRKRPTTRNLQSPLDPKEKLQHEVEESISKFDHKIATITEKRVARFYASEPIRIWPMEDEDEDYLSLEEQRRIKRTKSSNCLFQHSWEMTPYCLDLDRWKQGRHQRRLSTTESILTIPSTSQSTTVTEADQEDEIEPEDFSDPFTELVSQPAVASPLSSSTEELERGLEFDMVKMETASGTFPRRVITGGLLEKLVSRLADLDVSDAEYLLDFLYSFPRFMTAEELLSSLITRFYFLPPENATDEVIKYHTDNAPVIRLRVVNVLWKWLLSHYYDFLSDDSLLKQMLQFISEIMPNYVEMRWVVLLKCIIQMHHPTRAFEINKDSPLDLIEATMRREDANLRFHVTKKKDKYYKCCLGSEIVEWLLVHLRLESRQEAAAMGSKLKDQGYLLAMSSKVKTFKDGDQLYRLKNVEYHPPPKTLVPSKLPDVSKLKFSDIEPKECARQLTLISETAFAKISPRELIDLSWAEKANTNNNNAVANKNSRHVVEFSARFNKVADWVVTEIVLAPNMHQRKDIIQRFLQVAKYCHELKNYNDLTAIISGLNSSPVLRLKKTWKHVDSKYKNLKEVLEGYSIANQKLIREIHKKGNAPFIPCFGLIFGDLIRLNEVPDRLEKTGFINFNKCRVSSSVYRQIERYKASNYSLKPVPVYQEFLHDHIRVVNDHKLLYKYSVACEPSSDV